MSENTTATTPTLPDLSTVTRWQNDLLDFSGRNRSLFYRPTQSTVSLAMGEQALWSQLSTPGASIDLNDDLLLPPTLPAATATNPDPRGRALDDARKRLRNLHGQTRTFLDEQGVHVLHVPIGWLTWPDETRPPGPRDEGVVVDGGKKARLVHSPLLFLPVSLEQNSRGWRLVRPADVPVEANLTLLGYLRSLFRIDVAIDEEEDLEPLAVLAQYEAAIGRRAHWELQINEASSRIDTFSFKKVALLRELERSHDLVAAQPLLRALCGDASLLQQASNLREYAALDDEVQPGEVALAVAADSSQLRAVLAVLDGNSIVIQGPPGTGKSQTITNLISAAVARGQRVLFVAEKRAARDVVVSNLEKAHLGDLVLHITAEALVGRNATAKKDIAEQLRLILEQGPGHYEADERVPGALKEARDRLNEYVRNLHTPLGDIPWSTPYRLMESWSVANQALLPADPLPVPSVREVDDRWLDQVIEAANSLDDLGAPALRSAHGPWLWMKDEALVEDFGAIETALQTLVGFPEAAAQHVQRFLPSTGEAATHEQLSTLRAALEPMAKFQKLDGKFFKYVLPAWWSAKSKVGAFEKTGGTAAPDAAGSLEGLNALSNVWEGSFETLARFYPVVRGEPADVAAIASELLAAHGSFGAAQQVLRVVQASHAVDSARWLLVSIVAALPGDATTVTALLDVALFYAWADEASVASSEFAGTGPARSRLRDRFRQTDEDLLDYSYTQALNAFAQNRPGMDTIAPAGSELGILRAQIAAKRRKPLRWLFSNAASAILRLKPCIAASPLAVAQFLAHRAYEFDLVVFDEASQIPTADAVVAMSRGRQVVVVGDSQQMPPTAFFDRALESEDDDADAGFEFESILQQCEALLPSRRLLWHYRSKDERLIAFSNSRFYDGSLLTFPPCWSDNPEFGVKFVHVPDAVYGRGGAATNPDEAKRIAEVLVEEIRKAPRDFVAVTAMSISQQAEVQARIESDAAQSTELQTWLDAGNRVKNLETVQGDECDVMLLSFGYGKDAEGHLQLNFGPLSRDDGYRRLNVAVTRARRKTILVASIRASDIPVSVGAGGTVVRQYLDYAERGPAALEGQRAKVALDDITLFENEVADRLRARGWTVDLRVGVGTYRVDLGVRHPDDAGRYLAGIECDGDIYAGAGCARDRDIGRTQVLERFGWKLYRVWSPDWFRGRDAVLDEIESFLHGLVQPAPVEEPAPTPAPAPAAAPPAPPEEDDAPAFVAAPDLPGGSLEYVDHIPMPVRGHIADHIILLVRMSGPLHEDELLAALREDANLGRITATIRQQLQNSIDAALISEQVIRRGEWYWPAGMDERRAPVRVNREARRKLEYYSDAELLRGIEIACGEAGRLLPDQLLEATARFLGYNLTAAVRERLTPLIGQAARDRLQANADGTLEARPGA